MSLTIERFDEFFAALHGQDRTPYRWQRELLERLLSTGRWPQQLDIPTGGGKSTAIEIHVFANAVAQQRAEEGQGDTPRVPRRLSMIVARRAVVDDHLTRASALMEALDRAQGGILAQVRDLLVRRGYPADIRDEEKRALRVHLLRGGSASVTGDGSLGRRRDEWIHHPAAVQILCGTPDMIGSRLLHRGYGVTSRAQPRSAGLLGHDHVAVLDEAHLSRQLLDTFRRVSRMCGRWNPATAEVPALQVCAATATHAPTAQSPDEQYDATQGRISLDWDQLEEPLGRILTQPKPVDYLGLKGWNSGTKKALSDHASQVLEQVEALRAESSGTIGVVVNRVMTAVEIQELAHRSGLRTRLLVGPQRVGEPRDLRLEEADLVVATQTIEVGVDVDFAGMVTDLAPASALIQRAGRVNRRGERAQGRVIVIGPEGSGAVPPPEALPYEGDDLRQAREWIRELSQDPAGISPRALRDRAIPATAPDRPVLSHLGDADARLLSRTSERLFAEPDLTFWLRDSLDSDEQEVRVIGRTLPRLDQNLDPGLQGEVVDAAYQLLHQLEYEDQEIYPSTPARVRAVLTRKGLDPVHQAWVHRDGEWTLLRPDGGEGLPHAVAASGFPLRGGDLVVLDAGFPCTLGISADEAAGTQGAGTVLLPEGDRPIGDHSQPESLGVWTFLHQVPPAPADQETEETRICRAAGEAEPDEDGRIAVEDLPLRDGLPEGAYDVLLGPVIEATDGEPAWVTCTIRREAVQDERLALSDSGRDPQPVLLKDHQEDVAVRAEALGELLALPPFVRDALREAGLKHDAGKKTSAFQTRLFLGGNHRGEGLSAQERGDFRKKQRKMSYAKSEGLLPLSRTQADPVPKGWRHEMVSAAMFWADQTVGNPTVLPEIAGQAELTAWLIGTHHGLGRCGFPVGVAQLLGALSAEERQAGVEEAVRLLYGVGLWEDLAALMERTFGPWATSYLEALLRAADTTISQEGR